MEWKHVLVMTGRRLHNRDLNFGEGFEVALDQLLSKLSADFVQIRFVVQ